MLIVFQKKNGVLDQYYLYLGTVVYRTVDINIYIRLRYVFLFPKLKIICFLFLSNFWKLKLKIEEQFLNKKDTTL